ncbi:MAG: hypothetical protein EOP68_12990, partial [Sphingomonas sp.]
MLAGLLFAIHDADDRPDRLAATLPFSGVTLIEYQARLLIAAGVRQVIVVVARLTPELLGAINRINRRDDAGPGFERVGGQMAWAGVARLEPARIAEVAGLPNDYDLQSTLLRIAVQARAVQILL